MEEILYKYFGDDKILYYTPSDLISNDHFIRYSYHNHDRRKAVISIGNNDGEIECKVFTSPDSLETFIKILIYG